MTITREQIIAWAREAGIIEEFHGVFPSMERFAALIEQAVRADENEQCARVCDARAMHCETKAQEAIEAGEHDDVSAIRSTAWQISVCATAIRARRSQA